MGRDWSATSERITMCGCDSPNRWIRVVCAGRHADSRGAFWLSIGSWCVWGRKDGATLRISSILDLSMSFLYYLRASFLSLTSPF